MEVVPKRRTLFHINFIQKVTNTRLAEGTESLHLFLLLPTLAGLFFSRGVAHSAERSFSFGKVVVDLDAVGYFFIGDASDVSLGGTHACYFRVGVKGVGLE